MPLEDAIAALDAGDLAGLESILDAAPDLVHARVETSDKPYDGYFHRAALLHHVAGNPVRCPLPPNIVDVAKLLIERGADVEATCGGGPTQPDTGGGTTLGLVASSGQAAESGLAAGLIDVLVAAGADVNHLWTALYHSVECRKQRDVARLLFERGAEVDLCFAAALGERDRVASFIRPDGTLGPGAYLAKYRPAKNRMESPTDQQVLDEALMFAAMNGRDETIDQLLAAGADVNALVPVAGMRVTPLHGAAWAGWPVTTRRLIERGADVNRRDPVHHSAPPGWAVVCRREEVLDVFKEFESRYDLANSAEFGCLEQVRRLLGDADPDHAVDFGEPGVLLRIAAWEGRLDVVKFLVERGADPNRKNKHGHDALHYAVEQGRDDVAQFLREQQEPSAR